MKKSGQYVLRNWVVLTLFTALFGLGQILSSASFMNVSGQSMSNIPPVVQKPTPPAQTSASPSNTPPNGNTQNESNSSEVVRIETTLVTVPVSVTDREGRYITDLSKEDFRIFENGTEQEIAYFAAVEKPFTVVLMLDTSASMWSKLGKIKDAARAFVEQLRPEDQVAVISFGRGLKVQCEPTSDRKKIHHAIGDVGRGLSTRIYDAVDKVMRNQIRRIQGRKAIVLFTDGVDATSEKATYESTVHDAEELDALIYPILYDTYDPQADKSSGGSPPRTSPIKLRLPSILGKIPLPMPTQGNSNGGGTPPAPGSTRYDYDRGEKYLRNLAELTGGRLYEAQRDLSYLRTAFSNIAEELRRQYSLGYYPVSTATGGHYQIKVRVQRSGMSVRARSGYVRR